MSEPLGSQERPHFEMGYTASGAVSFTSEGSPLSLLYHSGNESYCLSWPSNLSRGDVGELMGKIACAYGVDHCQSIAVGGRLIDGESLDEVLVEGSLPWGRKQLRLESSTFTILWESPGAGYDVPGGNDKLSIIVEDKTFLDSETLHHLVSKVLERSMEHTEVALWTLRAQLNTTG